MKMIRKKVLFLTLCSVILLLAACNSVEKESSAEIKETDESYKFGAVLMTLNSEYWKIQMAGAKDAAEELGVEVSFLGPPEETQFEQQVKMVEDHIATGADALIVAASQPDAMISVLNNAHTKKIPIVIADADVNFDDKVTFIGTENYDAAKLGGDYLDELLNTGDKVAIIRGQSGSKLHDERTKGFQDALKDKNIEFIVQDAQSDRVKAVNIMENILTSNPDIKAVFATSDEMALGTYTTLENKNATGIHLIGFDGTPDGLQAVQEGKMLANVAQNPYQIGYQSVQSAYKAKKGEEVEKRIDSGALVITKENVEEEIKKVNGYLNNMP
ncbi:sugar ABC transporter substrate-binding protein [Sporosarcina newyorkensis]|uniref:Ribose transport system substrate-binding protein n=1 Tax=Sporosarcina newyorkensis TaxID=759851 RepID=A0A1T4YL79_9BACL|nr:sugar ABC transporter substrate-binding protein [Sporosarcina newyorkensis]SKB02607.1 ribose transport system substrate-binding protein [Sporosarcina newyorkensis]